MSGARTLDIVYAHPATQGWATVTLMARLAAELLDGRLIDLPRDREYGRLARSSALLPRLRGHGDLLVIAAAPGDLVGAARLRTFLPGYRTVSGWVIDSFWDDRIPAFARRHTRFDHLFITDAELTDRWQEVTGVPTHWLPFGTDALAASVTAIDRPVDVQRVGRMPASWDDDATTSAAAAGRGLRYLGRPPFHADPEANQAELLGAMSRAKFTLSFSNAVSPAPYTHPTREYLTGRWTDALANGATVAGIAPRCRATSELLWPEALVELPGTDTDDGLDALADAARTWTPDLAVHQRQLALQNLDWRLRFNEIAEVTGRRTTRLDEALRALTRATGAPS